MSFETIGALQPRERRSRRPARYPRGSPAAPGQIGVAPRGRPSPRNAWNSDNVAGIASTSPWHAYCTPRRQSGDRGRVLGRAARSRTRQMKLAQPSSRSLSGLDHLRRIPARDGLLARCIGRGPHRRYAAPPRDPIPGSPTPILNPESLESRFLVARGLESHGR